MGKKQQYYGPFTIQVDDDEQQTTVHLKRRGPEHLQPEIRQLRAYVLQRAAEYGYRVVEA